MRRYETFVILDPDFANNRWSYISYSGQEGDLAGTEVARAKLREHSLEDLEVILKAEPKTKGVLHYGSRLVFASDGSLLISLGEHLSKSVMTTLVYVPTQI